MKSDQEINDLVQHILSRSRARPKPKTLEEMTAEELAAELQSVEAQRQAVKYRRGPEASQTKAWARRRKAAIRAEFKRRGLAAPRCRSFAEWAGVAA